MNTTIEKAMPVLRRIDETFAGIATELIRNHCNDDVFNSLNEAWELLKSLIHNLEQSKENNDGKKQD